MPKTITKQPLVEIPNNAKTDFPNLITFYALGKEMGLGALGLQGGASSWGSELEGSGTVQKLWFADFFTKLPSKRIGKR
jgi:hypothetical protein